jgi:hypothetical protein
MGAKLINGASGGTFPAEFPAGNAARPGEGGVTLNADAVEFKSGEGASGRGTVACSWAAAPIVQAGIATVSPTMHSRNLLNLRSFKEDTLLS